VGSRRDAKREAPLARAGAGEIREDVAFDDVVCMATAISLAASDSAADA
jgi:hypothetical protein